MNLVFELVSGEYLSTIKSDLKDKRHRAREIASIKVFDISLKDKSDRWTEVYMPKDCYATNDH